jgi:hypothetical protein
MTNPKENKINYNRQLLRLAAGIAAVLSAGCITSNLQSILVNGNPKEPASSYQPTTSTCGDCDWKLRLTLASPAPAGGVLVHLFSSNPQVAPLPQDDVQISAGLTVVDLLAPKTKNVELRNVDVTIAATEAGTFATKKAVVTVGTTPRRPRHRAHRGHA